MIAMLASTVLSLPAVAQQPNQPQRNQAQSNRAQPNQAQHQQQPNQAQNQQSKSKIRQVQSALEQKGFKAGPQDGILGHQTQTALRNFQKQQRAQPTGKLDNRTLAALGVNTQGQGQNPSGSNAQPKPQSNTGGHASMSQQASGPTGQNDKTNGK
jgi:peptidoglycan hydrolase-like protein with peptidoglycan-binding domain